MFPIGCRILPRKHLHKYSGGANFVELRQREVRRISIPRTSVNKGKKKQLSWMSSRNIVRRPPGSTVFEDGVEDREQLAHAGHQCHLLRFASRQKTLVESPYDRVAARGYQGAHVERRSDLGST